MAHERFLPRVPGPSPCRGCTVKRGTRDESLHRCYRPSCTQEPRTIAFWTPHWFKPSLPSRLVWGRLPLSFVSSSPRKMPASHSEPARVEWLLHWMPCIAGIFTSMLFQIALECDLEANLLWSGAFSNICSIFPSSCVFESGKSSSHRAGKQNRHSLKLHARPGNPLTL